MNLIEQRTFKGMVVKSIFDKWNAPLLIHFWGSRKKIISVTVDAISKDHTMLLQMIGLETDSKAHPLFNCSNHFETIDATCLKQVWIVSSEKLLVFGFKNSIAVFAETQEGQLGSIKKVLDYKFPFKVSCVHDLGENFLLIGTRTEVKLAELTIAENFEVRIEIIGSLDIDDFGFDFTIKNLIFEHKEGVVWVVGDRKLGKINIDPDSKGWRLILSK